MRMQQSPALASVVVLHSSLLTCLFFRCLFHKICREGSWRSRDKLLEGRVVRGVQVRAVSLRVYVRMADQRNTTMSSGNVKLMPLRGRDEITLLFRSQRAPHFEKTLPASSVYSDYLKGPSTLKLPAWFVEEHGDKYKKSVLLRSASSARSWAVNLTVSVKYPSTTQVRFAGGWQAFAVWNGLARGDSLIFALTAMSEFRVYVFCGKSGSPKAFPSQPPSPLPRSWSKKCELARKKAKQSSEQLAAEADVKGAVKSTGLIAETKIVRDHSEEKLISASGPSSAPCRLSFHGNPIESGKASDSSSGEQRSHESPEDIIQLEVLPQSATTYGPAQQTRARALGMRLCSTQHPVFFKKPAVGNFFRLCD